MDVAAGKDQIAARGDLLLLTVKTEDRGLFLVAQSRTQQQTFKESRQGRVVRGRHDVLRLQAGARHISQSPRPKTLIDDGRS